ncbi:hypothetical protein [Haloferax denitrificans]|uniref:hypothetical protein n=1 Tax=Haloferax denitrificans TaxID=35745 RepID=UPI003C6F44C3
MGTELDFLDVGRQHFQDFNRFKAHIEEKVTLSSLDGKLSVVGSISNYNSKDDFTNSLSERFEVVREQGNLLLLKSKTRDVSCYVHINDGCPLFFTTGTKTKDIPKTIGEQIKRDPQLSRMWVGKRRMEEIRQEIANDDDVLIPYFTAHYSPSSDVKNVTRKGVERTIQYYGNDGKQTFKEMKEQYGVFPTNVQFKKPGSFKFRITQDGVFTLNSGSATPVISALQDTVEQLREVKDAVNSSSYETVESGLGRDHSVPVSNPWKIELTKPLTSSHLEYFQDSIESDNWDFGVSRYDDGAKSGETWLSAEVVDKVNYGRIGIRTKSPKTIRIYPREMTGFGPSMRLFSFVSNHLDQYSQADKV